MFQLVKNLGYKQVKLFPNDEVVKILTYSAYVPTVKESRISTSEVIPQ